MPDRIEKPSVAGGIHRVIPQELKTRECIVQYLMGFIGSGLIKVVGAKGVVHSVIKSNTVEP